MDEADEVAPLVPMLHRRERALSVKTPDFVEDRFQADAMLVDRPEFDAGAGEGRHDFPEEWADLFLKPACSTGSACSK